MNYFQNFSGTAAVLRNALVRTVGLLILSAVYYSAAAGQSAGTISGTVVYGADNTPIHNASVRLTGRPASTETDAEGRFSFTGLESGRYTVVVHQEGFGDMSRVVTLSAGENVAVEFRLQIAGITEEVTVTASGAEQSVFESIASVSTVNSTEITRRAAVGLGDILENESGVAKRSGGAGNTRPVIRGFDGDRVLIASDGMRVGSLGSQSGDHSEPVDALSLERIEVVKGPATLLYGSNAIGGVVNAISGHDEETHPGMRGYLSAVTATNNKQAVGSAGIDVGIGKWLFWGNGTGQRTSDYSAGGEFGKVRNTFTRNAAAGFGIGYFGSKAFAKASYTGYQSRYGVPLDFREEQPELRSLRVWRNDLKANFGYAAPSSAITNIKFALSYSNYRHQEIADGEVGTTFRNNVMSYRGMFDQKKVGRLTGRFGFDGYRRDYATLGAETLVSGKVRQDSFSVFALEEIAWERVTLQFGGRVESNRYRPESASLMRRSFTGASGAAGIRFALWDGGAFVANYTHAFRAPALEELYNNGPHDGTLAFEIGNSALRPETSDGIDLSLRHQSGRFKAEANFFHYALKNFVFLAPTGDTDEESGFPIAEYLQGDSRFTGAELNFDVTAHKYLSINGGVDYVNAELKSGLPLPRIAPLRGRIGLDLHYKNLTVRPELIAVASQDRLFVNETRTAGYGLFNIGATYIIPGKHVTSVISANAFNLTDRLYFNHVSFIKDISPEIGRGLRLSYTLRFY